MRKDSPEKIEADPNIKNNLLLHPKQGFYTSRLTNTNVTEKKSDALQTEIGAKLRAPIKLIKTTNSKRLESENFMLVKESKTITSKRPGSQKHHSFSNLTEIDVGEGEKTKGTAISNFFRGSASAAVLRERTIPSVNCYRQNYLQINQKKNLHNFISFDQPEMQSVKFETRTLSSAEVPSEDIVLTEEAEEQQEEEASSRYLALDKESIAGMPSQEGVEKQPALPLNKREIMNISKYTIAHASEFYKRKIRDSRKKIKIPTLTKEFSPSEGQASLEDANKEKSFSKKIEEYQKRKTDGKFIYSTSLSSKKEGEKQISPIKSPLLNATLSKKDIMIIRYKQLLNGNSKNLVKESNKLKAKQSPLKIIANEKQENYTKIEVKDEPNKEGFTPEENNDIRASQAPKAPENLRASQISKSLSPMKKSSICTPEKSTAEKRATSQPREKKSASSERANFHANEVSKEELQEKKRKLLLRLELEKILAQQRRPMRQFLFSGKKEKKEKDIFLMKERLIPNLARIEEEEEFLNLEQLVPLRSNHSTLNSLAYQVPLRAAKSENDAYQKKEGKIDDDDILSSIDGNIGNLKAGISKQARLKVDLSSSNKSGGEKKKGKSSKIRKSSMLDDESLERESAGTGLKEGIPVIDEKRELNIRGIKEQREKKKQTASEETVKKYSEHFTKKWLELDAVELPEIEKIRVSTFSSGWIEYQRRAANEILQNSFHQVELTQLAEVLDILKAILQDADTGFLFLLKHIRIGVETLALNIQNSKRGEYNNNDETILKQIDACFLKIELILSNISALEDLEQLTDELFEIVPGEVLKKVTDLSNEITNSVIFTQECSTRYRQLINYVIAEANVYCFILNTEKLRLQNKYFQNKEALFVFTNVNENFVQRLRNFQKSLLQEIELKYEKTIPFLTSRMGLGASQEEASLLSFVYEMESRLSDLSGESIVLKREIKQARNTSNEFYIQDKCQTYLEEIKRANSLLYAYVEKVRKLRQIFSIRDSLKEIERKKEHTASFLSTNSFTERKSLINSTVARLTDLKVQLIENNAEEIDILRTGEILNELKLLFVLKSQTAYEQNEDLAYADIYKDLEEGGEMLKTYKDANSIRRLVFFQNYESFLEESDRINKFIARCERNVRVKSERRRKSISEKNVMLLDECKELIKYLNRQKTSYIYNSCKSFCKKSLASLKLTEILETLKKSEDSSKFKAFLLKEHCSDFLTKYNKLCLKMEELSISKKSENWLQIANTADFLKKLITLTALDLEEKASIHERFADDVKSAFNSLSENNILGLSLLDLEIYLLHLKNIKQNFDKKKQLSVQTRLQKARESVCEQAHSYLSESDIALALGKVAGMMLDINDLGTKFLETKRLVISDERDEEFDPDYREFRALEFMSLVIKLIFEVKKLFFDNSFEKDISCLTAKIEDLVEKLNYVLLFDNEKIGKIDIPIALINHYKDLKILAHYFYGVFSGMNKIFYELAFLQQAFALTDYELVLGDKAFLQMLRKFIFLSKLPKNIFREVLATQCFQIVLKHYKNLYLDMCQLFEEQFPKALRNYFKSFDLEFAQNAIDLLETHLRQNYSEDLRDIQTLETFLISEKEAKVRGRENVSSFKNVLNKLAEYWPRLEALGKWIGSLKGLENKMKEGLENKMKEGLENKMKGGLENKMKEGLENKMKEGLENKMKKGLENNVNDSFLPLKLSKFHELEAFSEKVKSLLTINMREITSNIHQVLNQYKKDCKREALSPLVEYVTSSKDLILKSPPKAAKILKMFIELFVMEFSLFIK